MLQDQYGHSSISSFEITEYINQFADELLSGKKISSIINEAKKFPNEAILQILAAIYYLYSQNLGTQDQVKEHLQKASTLLEQANEKEKSLYSVAECWKNFEFSNALKQIERHCFKWPNDLIAIKIAEFLFYCKGQKYESKRFLRLTNHCYSEHKNNPFFLSIHSLALELNEKYEESWQIAQQALQMNEQNPWIHRTLSYIYLKKGQIKEGIEFMEHFAPFWNQYSRSVESHNLWLLALLYFENLDFDKIQKIYKQANWLHSSHSLNEKIDVIALLWRFDFENQEEFTTSLWKSLATSIENCNEYGAVPFLSAHLCYALQKGQQNEELSKALIKIEAFALAQEKEDRFVWRDTGLSLIHGCLSFANKQYHDTLRYFEPIIEKMGCVGGSDIQIDLFYQTYLKSLIGVHRFDEAENFLLRITQGRNLTKLEHKWLTDCR